MAGRALKVVLALLLSLARPPETASSQSDGDPVTLGTYRVFHSEILGEDRVLQVHLPRGYDSAVLDYPVVYLFYSDWVELYYAEAVNTLTQLSTDLMPQVILVGVVNTDRYRDLYPWPRADGWGGEAERFLRFVREELFPFIDAEYRTKDFRAMVGPQAAAVFGVYTLLEAPGTFDALIVRDPCRIDSEERALCEALARFAATPEAAGHFFAVSHVERDERWPSTRLVVLREELEKGAVGDFRWRISADPDWRLFLAPLDLRENLLALFQGYAFQLDREVGGLSDVLSHYEALSRQWGFTVDPPDQVLSQVSDQLTEAERFPAALEVLHHLVSVHPSSVNGYWRLANLYRVTGDTANPIRYYRECLEREPNMPPARTWLERLGGGGQVAALSRTGATASVLPGGCWTADRSTPRN